MKTLFIIGNGFDIHHDLPTRYSDYHKYIISQDTYLENIFEDFFEFKTDSNYLWSDFERDLGTFNWRSFFNDNCHLDILHDKFKPSEAFNLEDDLLLESKAIKRKIKSSFANWIECVNLEETERKLKIPTDSLFLNFNYTLTLESVYNIPSDQVIHIHGDIETNNEDLIFGHAKQLVEEPELDEYGDSNRTLFTDSENAAKYLFYTFHKHVNTIISEKTNFFSDLMQIKEIVVLGHSLSKIDEPYFKEIYNFVGDAFWHISYYGSEEEKRHIHKLQKIGIEKNKIRTFQMNELNIQ